MMPIDRDWTRREISENSPRPAASPPPSAARLPSGLRRRRPPIPSASAARTSTPAPATG